MWRIQPAKSMPMPRNISPNNLIGIDEENSWAIQTSLTSALAFPALAEQWWSLNVTDLLGSPENGRKLEF
jgi:hypothetical protein